MSVQLMTATELHYRLRTEGATDAVSTIGTKTQSCGTDTPSAESDRQLVDKAISPIDKLPPEVLQEIFILHAKPPFLFLASDALQFYAQPAALVLLCVCSEWRKIALGTPELWDQLRLRISAHTPHAVDLTMKFVHEWFDRARDWLVYLDLMLDDAIDEYSVKKVFNVISSHHFRKLHIACPLQQLLQFGSSLNTSLYDVKEISLKSTDDSYSPHSVPLDFPVCSEGLARLETLRLNVPPFFTATALASIPWHQLRCLDMGECPQPATLCLEILRCCESLVDCAICVEAESRIMGSEEVFMPNLQRLVLRDCVSGVLDDFIQLLNTPNLGSLSIVPLQEVSLATQAICSMAERSDGFPCLHEFCVDNIETPLEIDAVLSIMPALRSIILTDSATLGPDTLHDLSAGILGPHLELLQIGNHDDPDAMLEMVEMRQQTAYHSRERISGFSRVYFRCSVGMSDVQLERARQLEYHHGVLVTARQ
ncbi:hypothetical protein AX17_005045 [Amanita inopinata Kibby_2008]|nr:hypothetical protein AX17_005045 [Amanita inopinata Kibby_2008]